MSRTIAPIYAFATKQFVVSVVALEEYDLDLSWDETGETEKALLNGTAVAFCARATVTDRQGRVLACDYLGGCVYNDLKDFRTSGGTYKQGYFVDLVMTVCREARKTLRAHASIYLRV